MKITTYHSASEIPEEKWNQALGKGSITCSKAYGEIIEASGMKDFATYRYLLLEEDDGTPAAVSAYYTVTTDIAIFAPGWLRGILGRIRRVIPGFLKLRMIECGTAVNINEPVIIREGVNQDAVVRLLSEELFKAARREKALLLVTRDFHPTETPLQRAFIDNGWTMVPSLPNCWLDTPWNTPDEYLGAMKSYFRSKLKKHLKRNEQAGIEAVLVDDFDDIAEQLSRQWLVVHEQADEYQREVLTPDFYRAFSTRFGDASKVLLFYREGELIGHALLLMDRDVLRWMYFGRKSAVNDSLYILVGYKVVETAILLGARTIEQGVTTYSVKRDLGGQMIPVDLGLSSRWKLFNPLIKWGYGLLNSTPEIDNKNIFKEPDSGKKKKTAKKNPQKSRKKHAPGDQARTNKPQNQK